MVRYADDFVLLCRTPEEAERALRQVREWTLAEGLELHPQKTRVVDLAQTGGGFDFAARRLPARTPALRSGAACRLAVSLRSALGYHFPHGGKRWPRRQSEQKLKSKLRPLTKRTYGKSLRETIGQLNAILRGWYGYFRHTSRGLLIRARWLGPRTHPCHPAPARGITKPQSRSRSSPLAQGLLCPPWTLQPA